MPDIVNLKSTLEEYKYVVTDDVVVGGTLHCQLSGGELGEVQALLRATEDICNVGLVLGLLSAVAPRLQFDLLLDFLQLNFEHPLARVSVFRAQVEPDTPPYVGVMVAETSFYWTEPTKRKIDGRMTALMSIAKDASSQLASRHAISKSNPFFEKVRPISPPVERAQLAPDGTHEPAE